MGQRMTIAIVFAGLLLGAGCGGKKGGGGKCGEYFRRLKQNFSAKVTDDKKLRGKGTSDKSNGLPENSNLHINGKLSSREPAFCR